MKVALVLVVVAVSIALTSAALTCYGDKDKCQEDECCIRIPGTILGTCKPHRKEDDRCEMHPAKMLFPNHVYIAMCPCKEELSCIAKDGLVGKLIGTCQIGNGEPEE